MANQAFGRADDLLFGSGELFISIDGDETGWKHLGNVDEFIITTTTDAIEKNSSLNMKRELEGRVTTALSVTAEATLTEYDYRNVSIALFGKTDVVYQPERVVNKKLFTVNTVPGLITVTDENNKRYFGIKDISVLPETALDSRTYWTDAGSHGYIVSNDGYNDTLVTYSGGYITIRKADANVTQRFTVSVTITKSPEDVGNLYGMKALIYDSSTNIIVDKEFNVGMSTIVTLTSGIEVEFAVSRLDTFDFMSNSVNRGVSATVMPAVGAYISGIDYIADEQSCRAGIIKIPENSRIEEDEKVVVTCTVPDKNLCIISGGSRKDLTGQLLFVSDAAVGPNYVIEGWKVHIYPDGDLTGLISSGEFGSYKIKFSFVADYYNHPEAPHYAMTLVDYSTKAEVPRNVYNEDY